ncbi:hypothetical protein AHAS_Ahas20G0204500 [Arachis hypogaea]
METRVLFYDLEHLRIYEDPVQHSFYIVASEHRVCMYVLRDHCFRHPINTLLFNLDMPYEFSLAWLHPDIPHHPFHDGPGLHHHPVQPEDHVVLEPDPVEEYIPEPSSDTSAMIFSEIIEISDDDDEDPEECLDVIEISSFDDDSL